MMNSKRTLDISFAMAAVLVFVLPSIVIFVLLKYGERHSAIFRQERAGLNKKPFQIMKFQTMVDNTPTRIGRVLRKTGLDELPQFLNVLKGDMSIVGPRALTQFDIDRLGWGDAYHARRWEIKPGITGYAQLYGGQHKKTSWFWDRRYIDNNSTPADFGVIIVSFFMNVLGKTRVRNMIWSRRNLR
jgi:lipopolysaccharide/colanic/teichoic acid biosynthesis glycosyltransferase